MKINAQQLQHLRKIRNFSQQELANVSGVPKRTIQNIEYEKAKKAHQGRIIRDLAKALGVAEVELSRAPGASEEYWFSGTVHEVELDDQTNVGLELNEARYGVAREVQLNVAPLAFRLLAELSLQHRRQRLADLEAHVAAIRSAQRTETEAYINSIHRLEDHLHEEREALKEGSILKTPDTSDWTDGDTDSAPDPLTSFLQVLLDELPGADIEGIESRLSCWRTVAPRYRFADQERLLSYLDSDQEALFAFERGRVCLRKLPAELREQGRAKDRADWAKSHLTASDRKALSELDEITLIARETSREIEDEEAE